MRRIVKNRLIGIKEHAVERRAALEGKVPEHLNQFILIAMDL